MMPMLDVFAPDINSISARSVYPTAPGGTTASAGMALNQNTNVIMTDPTTGTAAVGTTAGAPIQPSGKGLWWWVGIVGLLLVTVFVARKAGGEEDFRNIRPTFYNFFAITLTAIVGIVGLKVIFGKYNVPGLSDVLLAV
jgi:hypothetical protein